MSKKSRVTERGAVRVFWIFHWERVQWAGSFSVFPQAEHNHFQGNRWCLPTPIFWCVCVCAGITPRTYCLPQISWKIFWFGHQNIPHVAVHNQTNVALFFAFAQSLIYEHGIKSTDFPQACGTCSVYFCELCGSGLDDWLSNSNSCLSDNPHMQCVVNCYKLQIVIGLHCFVSWSWTWPALWPVKLTNTTAGPAVREKAGSESVVNVGCCERFSVDSLGWISL